MNKKLLYIMLSLAIGSVAQAQSLRSIGMGGALLPGSDLSTKNTAYTNYSSPLFSSGAYTVPLPVGLLGLLRPQTNPFTLEESFNNPTSGFDALSFVDQVTHPFDYVLNLPTSPSEIIINISKDTVGITDGNGKPLRFNFNQGSLRSAKATNTSNSLWLVDLGNGNFMDIGVFGGVNQFGLNTNSALAKALAGSAIQNNVDYGFTMSLAGQIGASVRFGLASMVYQDQTSKVRAGTRGQLSYGLVYVEASSSANTKRLDNNSLSSSSESRVFSVYPGNGRGLGASGDVGVFVEGSNWIAGVGINRLFNYSNWQGTLTTVTTVNSATTKTSTAHTVGGVVFAPEILVNAAYAEPIASLGKAIVAADLGYSDGFVAHLGGEVTFIGAVLRAGVSYNNGFGFGLGGGLAVGTTALDLALTTHSAPLTGAQTFGIAAGISF